MDGQILVLTPTAFLATCCGPYQDNYQALCAVLEVNVKAHPQKYWNLFLWPTFSEKKN
jgi:hypothetical protein